MTSILIIYASTGGSTEMVAETISEMLIQKKHKVILQRAEQSKSGDISKADVLILASPTYGHGVLQEMMEKFLQTLGDVELKGKSCAVIGVGDPKYEPQYHIESATILEKFLTDHGGKLLLPALRISRSPVMHLKGLIPFWGKQLIDVLK